MIVRSLCSSLARTSGASIALRISAFNRDTISGGIFAGPKKPNQVDGLRNAGMISLIDGTFGILL